MIQGKYFYSFTRDLADQIGETTSFVWASYGGLWNMYSLSKKLGNLSNEPDWTKIEKYIFDGIPKKGGVDLKSISTKEWTYHEEQFTKLILTQGDILYEDWTVAIAPYITVDGKKTEPESFRFPTDGVKRQADNWAIIDASGKIKFSNTLTLSIKPELEIVRQKNIDDLNNLLYWYRFFKEARNCFVHNGGIVSERLSTVYNIAQQKSLSDLGINKNFSGIDSTIGQNLKIKINDAILMLAVIQRIANGFDAKYCYTLGAETYLKERIKSRLDINPMPSGKIRSEKEKYFRNLLIKNLGINPNPWPPMADWLEDNKFI